MKEFKTESKRILDLMINSIYTNKEIFLRELISNASDAIDKLKFISLTDTSVNSNFKIEIITDKEHGQLIIRDNGIGMNAADLEKNLGTIAESGTLAFKKENESEKDLIGQFGVGFYSAFMVADKIEVRTKKYGEEKAYRFESCGVEGYEISETAKDGLGTEITLTLKKDEEDYKYSDFLDQYKIISLVKKYSDYIRYPIETEVTRSKKKEGSPEDKPEYEDVTEKEILNSMVPLWKKPKAEVKDEDIAEFYKNEFHDYTDPLKSAYFKIEGGVTYDALLFIPSKAPYDYYSKDYKKGLKLYSNGVLIMEKCEDLLPDYLAFIRGIVDSSDLSLNISREILQQDRQVKAIATTLEKKILGELKKLLEEDRETYEKVFGEFGLSLKFGCYEMFGLNKDKLKDLLMFYSQSKEKLVTLSEYVKEMPEGQKEIYYACGESYEKIKELPKIEKAKEKGYDVLLMKDGVDEFVAKILDEYEGKKFKSVGEADFTFDTDGEKAELDKKSEELKDVLGEIEKALSGKVAEVKLTGELKTYPVCLSSKGEISIEMEKVLNSMPNQDGKVTAEKVLEISTNHHIIDTLKKVYEEDKEKLKKYAVVLYESARILEGLPVDSSQSFVSMLSDII